MSDTILTQHPDPHKRGVNIDKAKYDFIRAEIIKAVGELGPMSAMQLVRHLDARIGDEKFGASVGWYATAVRLDMEAKKEILYNREAKKPVVSLANGLDQMQSVKDI
jgi:hypothetical protein